MEFWQTLEIDTVEDIELIEHCINKKFNRWIHSIFEELHCKTEFVEKQQRTTNKE